MIVTDTNIISYFYIEGDYTELADSAFKKDHDWAVPFLWRSEFRNVLTLCIRNKVLTMDDALEVMRAAETQLRNNEYSVTSANVLQLVEKSNCSAYDCEFVALAHDFGVPLVTMDKKILKNFPETAMSLSDFLKK